MTDAALSLIPCPRHMCDLEFSTSQHGKIGRTKGPRHICRIREIASNIAPCAALLLHPCVKSALAQSSDLENGFLV